jgi:hypothetical protein
MRTHENLPALNKYTSRTQYEALLEIDKTKSILGVVMNGASSKTLGALVRCMWIKQKDYADADGVLREGWFVTDDGKHAMDIYKIKYDREQEAISRHKEYVDRCDAAVGAFYDEYVQVRPKLLLLEEEIKQIKDSLEKALVDAKNKALALAPHEKYQIANKHAHRVGISVKVNI